ncbi:hypothetical protein [Palleronia caenipelagi]|uniref:Uncharacterized protein n=1 Tax=Palleronia caenipelagi TaxID=2489174 RepID=A0A547Q6B0_9RHOB|nr:hypothetical protein [Palleronia caenipelagi]TRD21919.1 hypothetical protein FEV53_07670 [Palleronia caenipelagi]
MIRSQPTAAEMAAKGKAEAEATQRADAARDPGRRPVERRGFALRGTLVFAGQSYAAGDQIPLGPDDHAFLQSIGTIGEDWDAGAVISDAEESQP